VGGCLFGDLQILAGLFNLKLLFSVLLLDKYKKHGKN